MNNTEKFVDYFYKLAKKQKIVFVKDVLKDEETPKEIKEHMYSGNITGKLSRMDAYKKGLFCMTTNIGSVKQKAIIVFLREHEDYVNELLDKHHELVKANTFLEKRLKEIEKDIVLIGR